jgi:hypothetical protein
LTGTIGSTRNAGGTTGFGNIAGPEIERPSGLAAAGTFRPAESMDVHRSPLRDMEIAPGTYYTPMKVGGDRLEGVREGRDIHTEHESIRTKIKNVERKALDAFGGPSEAGREWNRMT